MGFDEFGEVSFIGVNCAFESKGDLLFLKKDIFKQQTFRYLKKRKREYFYISSSNNMSSVGSFSCIEAGESQIFEAELGCIE